MKLICSSRRTNKPRDVLLSFIRLVFTAVKQKHLSPHRVLTFISMDTIYSFFFFFVSSGISIKANRHTGPQQLSERFLTSHFIQATAPNPSQTSSEKLLPQTTAPSNQQPETQRPHSPTHPEQRQAARKAPERRDRRVQVKKMSSPL